ncbi:hypothetical protein OB919_15715 [Halobacteria archaeon AArc-curdl1]|uniref:Uncharacterized protein n=1 Tax=Natronosalvus hydrolyticus TaxID=2979988 RepID=A0AAP2ZA75_9EURY|nr:hypothetical protein [Halobacteria archaeon AArc-curdl1]
MSQTEDYLERLKAFFETDEAIPTVSALLIALLFVFFYEMGYRLIEMGTMLLFYAVLVRMWTAMTPSDSDLLQGPFSHGFFLFISLGAVAMGLMIEQWIASISGSILPAQFLALAVLVSRVYLNFRDSRNFLEAVLWENLYERYVVLIPCLFVILVPILIHQLEISTLLFFDIRFLVSHSTTSFLSLSSLGLGLGVVIYFYIEEYR